MESSKPKHEEISDERKTDLTVIPCELCGSLVVEPNMPLHQSKICRKANPQVIGGLVEEPPLNVESNPSEGDDDFLDEEGEGDDEEEGFSKKELQFIMSNFRRKISSCIQRSVEVQSILRYIIRYVEFLHQHAEMEDGLRELAGIVEEAVKCGYTKVVEVLFSCEPDLEWYIPKIKFTPEGDSILHLLCSSKRWEEKDKEEQLKKLLIFLIDKKYANLKAKNANQQQPFHLACSLRTPVAAQTLLDTQKQIDINAEDKQGRVPLHYALEKQHDKVIETLLDREAKVSTSKILHLACNLQNENLALYVLRVFVMSTMDATKAKDGEAKREEFYQSVHAAINSRDELGRSALYHACACGHSKLVEELINLEADPNIFCTIDISRDEGTALHKAIMNGHTACVKLLLDRGANPTLVTSNTLNTPLHLACDQQNEEMVLMLMEKAPQTEKALNSFSKTPFQCIRDKNLRKVMLSFDKRNQVKAKTEQTKETKNANTSNSKSKKKNAKNKNKKTTSLRLQESVSVKDEKIAAEILDDSIIDVIDVESEIDGDAIPTDDADVVPSEEMSILSIQLLQSLPWEVALPLSTLRQLEALPEPLKKSILCKLISLAEGHRPKISHTFQESMLTLHESTLSEGAKMIWQIDIDWSDRCQSYTDIYRIWSLQLDEEFEIAFHSREMHLHSTSTSFPEFPRIYEENSKFPSVYVGQTSEPFVTLSTDLVTSLTSLTLPSMWKIRTSRTQSQAISQHGNVIYLGSSGTGKTTCAILHLWSRGHKFETGQSHPFYSLIDDQEGDVPAVEDDIQLEDDSFVTKQLYVTSSADACVQVENYFASLNSMNFNQRPKTVPTVVSFVRFLSEIDLTLKERFFEDILGDTIVTSLAWEDDQNILMDQHGLIDHDYFQLRIFPAMSSNLNPAVVFHQILTIIKGSHQCLDRSQSFLSLEEYLGIFNEISRQDKSEIYAIFQKYETYKQQERFYDRVDAAHHIYKRLKLEGYSGDPIENICVDDVDQLSAVDLAIFCFVCSNPDGLTFCGNLTAWEQKSIESIFELFPTPTVFRFDVDFRRQNAIIDLENSLKSPTDPKISGTWNGPKPQLSNKIQESHETFGCNQAIIVRSEKSRSEIAAKFPNCIVLTLEESAGFSFDQVLLFNFFADGTLPQEDVRVLLKATTLTACQLIICDTEISKRIQLENSWVSRDLVQVTSEADFVPQEVHPDLWRSTGQKLLDRRLYSQAGFCFENSGDVILQETANAFHLAQLASSGKSRNPKQQFQEAASKFMSVSNLKLAAQCLYSAREWKTAAEIFEELMFWEEAAICYQQAGDYPNAAYFFIQTGNVLQGIHTLEQGKSYNQALSIASQHKQDLTNQDLNSLVKRIIPKLHRVKDTKTVQLALNLIPTEDGIQILRTFKFSEELVSVLKRLKRFEEAAKVFEFNLNFQEAAQCYEEAGNFRGSAEAWLGSYHHLMMKCETAALEQRIVLFEEAKTSLKKAFQLGDRYKDDTSLTGINMKIQLEMAVLFGNRKLMKQSWEYFANTDDVEWQIKSLENFVLTQTGPVLQNSEELKFRRIFLARLLDMTQVIQDSQNFTKSQHVTLTYEKYLGISPYADPLSALVLKTSWIVPALVQLEFKLEEVPAHPNHHLVPRDELYKVAVNQLVLKSSQFIVDSAKLIGGELGKLEPCESFHMGYDCPALFKEKGVICRKNHSRISEEFTKTRIRLFSEQLYYAMELEILRSKFPAIFDGNSKVLSIPRTIRKKFVSQMLPLQVESRVNFHVIREFLNSTTNSDLALRRSFSDLASEMWEKSTEDISNVIRIWRIFNEISQTPEYFSDLMHRSGTKGPTWNLSEFLIRISEAESRRDFVTAGKLALNFISLSSEQNILISAEDRYFLLEKSFVLCLLSTSTSTSIMLPSTMYHKYVEGLDPAVLVGAVGTEVENLLKLLLKILVNLVYMDIPLGTLWQTLILLQSAFFVDLDEISVESHLETLAEHFSGISAKFPAFELLLSKGPASPALLKFMNARGDPYLRIFNLNSSWGVEPAIPVANGVIHVEDVKKFPGNFESNGDRPPTPKAPRSTCNLMNLPVNIQVETVEHLLTDAGVNFQHVSVMRKLKGAVASIQFTSETELRKFMPILNKLKMEGKQLFVTIDAAPAPENVQVENSGISNLPVEKVVPMPVPILPIAVQKKQKKSNLPLRPGKPNCMTWMDWGYCRFGSKCMYNHPKKPDLPSFSPPNHVTGDFIENSPSFLKTPNLPVSNPVPQIATNGAANSGNSPAKRVKGSEEREKEISDKLYLCDILISEFSQQSFPAKFAPDTSRALEHLEISQTPNINQLMSTISLKKEAFRAEYEKMDRSLNDGENFAPLASMLVKGSHDVDISFSCPLDVKSDASTFMSEMNDAFRVRSLAAVKIQRMFRRWQSRVTSSDAASPWTISWENADIETDPDDADHDPATMTLLKRRICAQFLREKLRPLQNQLNLILNQVNASIVQGSSENSKNDHLTQRDALMIEEAMIQWTDVARWETLGKDGKWDEIYLEMQEFGQKGAALVSFLLQ